MGILSIAGSQDAWCPRCGAALTGEGQRCNACGYSLEGVRLYDPRHFVWLAFLFSAMVPIFLAASNWGKVGESRRKWKWLGAGFAAFMIFFAWVVILAPDLGPLGTPAGHLLSLVIAYAINLPVGYVLRDEQRRTYESAVRLGARRGSLLIGSVLGLGLVCCAALPAAAFKMAKYQYDLQHGASLLAGGKVDEAAAVFERMLREDPEDEGADLSLALCDAARHRLAEAAERLERLVGKDETNPAAYALLAVVRAEQGKAQEAEFFASKARALDPGIFDTLLGPGNEFSAGAKDVKKEIP